MDIKIFLSYAREDKALADVLVRHLGKHKLIVWYDNYLHLGEDWKKKLISKLERANIILFLVSPDFISSDFCCETEVPLAMERFSQGEAHVIPIVARDTFWKETPYGHLQCFPSPPAVVVDYKGQKREKVFVEIVERVWVVIKALTALNEGNILFKRHNFAGAFTKYTQAIEFGVISSILYEKRGDASSKLGLFSYALEAYDLAIQCNEEAYERAIQPNPVQTKHAELWEKKADVFYRMLESQRIEETGALDQMLEAYNNAYTMMLEVYNKAREDISEDGIKKVALAKRFLMQLIRSKGNRLEAARDVESAVEAYEEALVWKPDNDGRPYPDSYYYLYIEKGKALFQLNRLADAFLAYNEVTSDNRAPKTVVDIAREGRRQIFEHIKKVERQREEIRAFLEREKPYLDAGGDQDLRGEGL